MEQIGWIVLGWFGLSFAAAACWSRFMLHLRHKEQALHPPPTVLDPEAHGTTTDKPRAASSTTALAPVQPRG